MSGHDRAAMRRRAAALDSAPHEDEGSLDWRADLFAWIDLERRAAGHCDLDTEPELHQPTLDERYIERWATEWDVADRWVQARRSV